MWQYVNFCLSVTRLESFVLFVFFYHPSVFRQHKDKLFLSEIPVSSNQMDPSIAPENGTSPFLESRDAVAFAILRTLSAYGEKNKMQMELVCETLKSLIENSASWEMENKLKLGQKDGNIVINGFKFTYEKAPSALSKLLDRITVEKLVVDGMSDVPEKVVFDLCHAITKHSNFIKLKYIQFTAFSNDSTAVILIMGTIIGCGLKQVTEIECGESDVDRDIDDVLYVDSIPLNFHPVLLCCPKLKKFTLLIEDILPAWEHLLPALTHCPDITHLYIDGLNSEVNLSHQKAIEFAKICSSTFRKLTYLDFSPTIEAFEPFEYLNAFIENEPTLSKQILSNITSFGIALDARVPLHRECLKLIVGWFPKLNYLDVRGPGKFPTDTLLDAIGNIFEAYGTDGETSYLYEFSLNFYAKNDAEVIFQLAKKRWNDDDEFVQMESYDSQWYCCKNNVRIELSFF